MYGTRPNYFEEGKHGGTINDIAIHGIDLYRISTGLTVRLLVHVECATTSTEVQHLGLCQLLNLQTVRLNGRCTT